MEETFEFGILYKNEESQSVIRYQFPYHNDLLQYYYMLKITTETDASTWSPRHNRELKRR